MKGTCAVLKILKYSTLRSPIASLLNNSHFCRCCSFRVGSYTAVHERR